MSDENKCYFQNKQTVMNSVKKSLNGVGQSFNLKYLYMMPVSNF